MASYSLHSYSSSDSSGGRSVSDDRRNIAEQGVKPIGASLGSTSDVGSSSSDRNERVRLDGPEAEHRGVKSPASSNNVDTDDDWVVQDVRSAYSRFLTPASLRALVDVQDIVDSSIPDGAFSLRRCLPTDRVFHSRSSFPVDFFFMYARVMKDSCIVIPFDDSYSDVLRFLNIAPTQLHPNGWAYVRAFQFVCSALVITPTIPLFFTRTNILKIPLLKSLSGRLAGSTFLTRRSPGFPYIGLDPLLVLHHGRGRDYRQRIPQHLLCLIAYLGVSLPEIFSTLIGVKTRTTQCSVCSFLFALSFYLSNCLIIFLLCRHPCCPDARHEQGIQGPDVVSTSWREQQAGCQG